MQVSASTEKTSAFHYPALTLALGCLGVVYGDIGTSPLYAFREAVRAAMEGGAAAGVDAQTAPDRLVVYGLLSLIFWALMSIVTLKYTVLMMRADNKGEGGVLSLMTLAQTAIGKKFGLVFIMGVAGAALFYGDAAITPAISVLSAVEGLPLIAPAFGDYVLVIAIAILAFLFLIQKDGTHKISGAFGPLVLIWFAMIALAGLRQIATDPAVLLAINPWFALRFIARHTDTALPVLGAIFLVVTGAETFYAYLGHFGARPIRNNWLFLVFPCLVLNYFGQGAFVLHHADGIADPFFMMMPHWALIPSVIVAIIATFIASQAVITSAFAVTTQAIRLGLLPRMEIRHMSAEHEERVYMPKVNKMLLYTVLLLCFIFKSSAALASAYGIAVIAAMTVSTILTFFIAYTVWNKTIGRAALMTGPFLVIEAIFLFASMQKIEEGGYVPLGISVLIMILMATWVRGTQHLYQQSHRSTVPLSDLNDMLERQPPTEIGGTAVFMTSDPLNAPIALMQNIRHNKVIHAHNIILTVIVTHSPRVDNDHRLMIEHISTRFTRVLMVFGYAEVPDVPHALMIGAKHDDILSRLQDATFFLGRRSIMTSSARTLQDQLARQWTENVKLKKPSRPRALLLALIQRTAAGLPRWQSHLYIALSGTAVAATDFYRIPRSQVVEMGIQLSV